MRVLCSRTADLNVRAHGDALRDKFGRRSCDDDNECGGDEWDARHDESAARGRGAHGDLLRVGPTESGSTTRNRERSIMSAVFTGDKPPPRRSALDVSAISASMAASA